MSNLNLVIVISLLLVMRTVNVAIETSLLVILLWRFQLIADSLWSLAWVNVHKDIFGEAADKWIDSSAVHKLPSIG